jgi:hypothetical protein
MGGWLMGTAKLDVNVKALKGTSVNAKADGVFKEVKVDRAPQMPHAKAEFSDWAYE